MENYPYIYSMENGTTNYPNANVKFVKMFGKPKNESYIYTNKHS